MTLVQLRSAGVAPTFSPLESKRFGMRVGRLIANADCGTVPHIASMMAGFDLLIARVHANHCGWTFTQEFGDLRVDHADTLVYLQKDPHADGLQPSDDSATVDRFTSDDADALSTALRSSFDGYQNHYSRNPGISVEHLIDGYLEWGLSHLSSATGSVYGIRDEKTSRVATFCCVETESGGSELTLGGTPREFRGRGLYVQLFQFLADAMQHEGLVVSTQLSNLRVHNMYRALGWRDIESFHTYHISHGRLHSKDNR